MCALCECCGCLDSYSKALCEAGSVQRERKGDRNSPPHTTHSHSYRADANFHVIETPHIQCNRKTQLRFTVSLCVTSVYSQRKIKNASALKGQFLPKALKHINFLKYNPFYPSRLFWRVDEFQRFWPWRHLPSLKYNGTRWHSGCVAQSVNKYISTSQWGAKLFFPH